MNMRIAILLGVVLTVALPAALAQAPFPETKNDNSDGWVFSFAPYFWAPSLNGDVNVKGRRADVSESFSDIWSDLTFGGMFKAEAHHDRFGVLSDTMYVALKTDTNVSTPGGTPLFDINSKFYQWIVDLAGSFEVTRWEMGSPKEQGTLDVYAGGRYWNLETKLHSSSAVFGTSHSLDDMNQWIDPIVGSRVLLDLTDNLRLLGQGDIGGFDIGNSSKLTWSVEAYLGWSFSEAVSAWLGWKYLYVDHEYNNGNDLRVHYSGPAIGVAFRF